MQMKVRFFLFFITVSLALSAQSHYPSYDSVVRRFFNVYTVKNLSEDQSLKFEKRPEGWFVSVFSGYPAKATVHDLFWSRKTGTYFAIHF
jgi:hypothetical protein